MTKRVLLKPFAALVVVLVMMPLASALAQQNLPWDNGQNATDKYGSKGRVYEEPGEAYNPAKHGQAGSQQQSRYGQGQSGYQVQNQPRGRYDSGYDALRNNGQASQSRSNRPYANEGGRGYEENRGYEQPRGYDEQRQRSPRQRARQPRYPQQGAQQRPSYPRQDYGRGSRQGYQQGYQPPASSGPGQPYAPPSASGGQYNNHYRRPAPRTPAYDDTFSDDEILEAGHRFFGKVTKGLAKVIAYVFKKSGRPNAYILGEEGGGALIAGLRYGEGTIYTKAGQRQRIYWQGPSIGYDFGAEGAKTMILVYNLRDINKIYNRYAGVDGSAYLVGGIGVTFQKRGRVVLAPIRSGLGVRLGANVGYLKYTRRPTWNPF